jgi:hypothetical protein
LQDRWSRPDASGADEGVPSSRHGDARHDPGYGGDDDRHDPVTGLPHPRCFLDRLERLLGGPDGSSRSVAILALEVSDFCDLKTRLGDHGLMNCWAPLPSACTEPFLSRVS